MPFACFITHGKNFPHPLLTIPPNPNKVFVPHVFLIWGYYAAYCCARLLVASGLPGCHAFCSPAPHPAACLLSLMLRSPQQAASCSPRKSKASQPPQLSKPFLISRYSAIRQHQLITCPNLFASFLIRFLPLTIQSTNAAKIASCFNSYNRCGSFRLYTCLCPRRAKIPPPRP